MNWLGSANLKHPAYLLLKKIVPTRGKVLLNIYSGITITLGRARRILELMAEITYPSQPTQKIVIKVFYRKFYHASDK